MNPREIMQMIQSFAKNLESNLEAIWCMVKLQKRLLSFKEIEFGRLPEELNPETLKSVDQLQYNAEGATEAGKQFIVEVRKNAGYYPRDGWISNTGEEPFKYILTGVRDDSVTNPLTIYPNQSHAIRSPISKVTITPLTISAVAAWQLSVN